MLQLRNYQIEAVERLNDTVDGLLRSSENEVCVFQAPTGSGKTVMVAEFLKKLVKDREDGKKFSFIWISVRRLHDQSKDKLEAYYEKDRLLKCSYFEDLEDRKIGENEILFINWHSINKKDINIYVKENEQDNNLNSILSNTKEDGREIILVIDESHHTASSEKSKELIEIISPKITLEVSATPHLTGGVSGMKVNLSDVKAEEMIKAEVSVNPEFMEMTMGSKSADELVIEQALKKRQELVKMYKKEGSAVNPLVLIQLPDKKEGMEDKRKEVVQILEDKFDITEENGKLAIWLSEDKSDNLPNIEKNENEVEVLIFKQAIALGWDCPRASILVIFRELKSFTFTIQTIGRIMRMPELKYYTQEPELNKGFVFTNLSNIEIAEDYVKDYVTIYESKRAKTYKDIALHSIYLKRQRERTRLSGKFIGIFQEVAEKIKLKTKVNPKPSELVSPVIADGKIVNIDKIGEIDHKGTVDLNLSERELQERFEKFIRENCTPYAPVDSSDRLKNTLYQFFKEAFGIEKYDPKVQQIVLGKENVSPLVEAINLAKEEYKLKIVQSISERRELVEVPNWEVPILISYSSRYTKEERPLSIMQPIFLQKPSEQEKRFMELLDCSDKVKWWFKNGAGEIKYFAVFGSDGQPFYVDFIVMFKDGRIGLFDTKSGFTLREAGPKSDGLREYIKKENSKGKKLFGGIVTNTDSRNFTGRWVYFDKPSQELKQGQFTNWQSVGL